MRTDRDYQQALLRALRSEPADALTLRRYLRMTVRDCYAAIHALETAGLIRWDHADRVWTLVPLDEGEQPGGPA